MNGGLPSTTSVKKVPANRLSKINSYQSVKVSLVSNCWIPSLAFHFPNEAASCESFEERNVKCILVKKSRCKRNSIDVHVPCGEFVNGKAMRMISIGKATPHLVDLIHGDIPFLLKNVLTSSSTSTEHCEATCQEGESVDTERL